MAEQSSNDVVNQTRSGGDLSPSDVPASKPDNLTAGGDRGGVQASDNNSKPKANTHSSQEISTGNPSSTEANGVGSESNDANTSLSPNVGDGSGGSDTDASRPDARSNTDGAQHSRTSSVKRPASFKPVSFAKFSVTKPPGSNGNSKASPEKAPFLTSTPPSSTSTPLSSRPRLVAKSGSGLRDSSPRTSTAGSKNVSGAPDANLVWNKNRPVQPPPTKHLTDEELKQQYGIHMTSRIQTDDNEKEAKWADIDDDEDDWAPETIEWNDGTKITLTHTEGSAPGSQETSTLANNSSDQKRQLSPANNTPPAREAPRLLLSKPSSSLGSNTTILKVGASAEKQQSKQGGDLSKTINDKPTLTSKGAAAVRSPWAPLPPVEKASPLAPNPPGQNQVPRFNHGEPSRLDTGPAPPTKEIAADDFNRSWRDRQPTAPRELYNSQSGRYEPVSDNRHGHLRNDRSGKNDGHFRPASLLQRSMNEQPGPAEPSPAFQTHRSSTEGSQWGRRRASSNVSGGSGGFARRMSLTRPELPFKGGPPSTGTLERSASPNTRHMQNGPVAPSLGSPSQQSHRSLDHGPPNFHQASPSSQTNVPSQGAADGQNSQPPVMVEDPVAMQQRIMREKREMARQRRLEQEAKEEAAKQERIRIKLQSMGVPANELPGAKDSTPSSNSESKKPTGPPSTSTTAISSPPKPPVPELTGEPKQYGMMKVHHPESVKKLVASSEKPPEKPQQAGNQAQNHQASSSHKQAMSDALPTVNGSKPAQEGQTKTSQPIYGPQPEERPPNWKYSVPPTSTYSWPSSKGHTAGLGALWGPPTNDKALGNGTFDRNLASFPSDLSSLGLTEQQHLYPQQAQEGAEIPEGIPRPLPPPSKAGPDNTKPLSPLSSSDHMRPDRMSDNPKPIAPPGPIAPPSYNQGQRWQQDRLPHRNQETAAWSNFHLAARKSELEENERFHQDLKALREEEAKTGIASSLQTTFNETWRQVEAGERPGNRNIIGVVSTTSDKEPQPSPFHQIDSVSGLSFSDKQKAVPPPSTRGSRFFPPASEPKRPNNQEVMPPRSQSPPPPEEVSSHPVFTGDSQRPLVHLPNPKPRVKLPPGSISAPSPPPPPPAPATFAAMVASPPPARTPAQPIASTTSWQDRFNGLFGKKTSQPAQRKNSSLAVASATKEPLDVISSSSSAAVSFPQYDEKRKFTGDLCGATTKEVEDEEAIFEDREAGSLPVVKVPDMAPRAAWHPAPKQPRFRTKYQKPVLSQSIEPYIVGSIERDSNGEVSVIVRPPGKGLKMVPLPKRGGSSSGKFRSNPKNRSRNPRSREGSGSYQNSHPAKKTASTTASTTSPASLSSSARQGSHRSHQSSTK
ncbi:hypothetical protein TESG_05424 [Trichophyton tonsurans CBS 112818]|uniref:Uncharacterized protein n=1 Tax=Trichophyton tonsurans (strain CBS 112818) TaxID=647933 RepID=F2S383_TRIT1|nr:hypothetical protein TESG_05424 [Trichophyton tonsurans CBS 112818]